MPGADEVLKSHRGVEVAFRYDARGSLVEYGNPSKKITLQNLGDALGAGNQDSVFHRNLVA